ncbi:MAG TPA: hypothetical protein DEF47_05785 [Herpetosiphon sp.]|uniref:Uncharacterized protein n=1 Tax=Herpetosiphon aurantiacus (strain ATCC 23779 / DSM 785 / 114-95) TaxID=316274 RepID=A9B5W4_HERA2|nr:hypothetical protein [Herpetosiphon sp.]ABX05757.1 hypothetical protein Haur_3119 [Herpetosiphon aurantiacus DSM 785]HBW49392.1 hypothetical protein [Herpetosiphon sp.]
MSDSTNQQAVLESQVRSLVELSEDDLFRKLGIQVKQAEEADAAALEVAQAEGAFAEPVGVEMGLGENLRAFGARWWAEIEPKLYNLLCASESKERSQILAQLPESKGGTAAAVVGGDSGNAAADNIATALAPLLIGLLPFNLPIIASVGATIAAKMILSSGLKTTCEMWQESIEAREEAKAKENPAE